MEELPSRQRVTGIRGLVDAWTYPAAMGESQPQPSQPIPIQVVSPSASGVPTQPTTTTSGSGTSPNNSTPSSSTAGPSPVAIRNFEIKSKLLRPALTSHYLCRFQPPAGMFRDPRTNKNGFLKTSEGAFPGSDYEIRSNQDLIELSCTEASLPGSSLITNEINDDYTGVTERLAYRRQYDDRIDFTFYVDHDYKIINFFERWMSFCVGEDSLTEVDDRNYNYRVNFPNTYQTDALYITKFERDYANSALEYKFISAYPISIASMPVSYDSSELLKCTVSFSYIRYVRKLVKIAEPILVGARENPDGKMTVEILNGSVIETKIISREEYNRKYAPR